MSLEDLDGQETIKILFHIALIGLNRVYIFLLGASVVIIQTPELQTTERQSYFYPN